MPSAIRQAQPALKFLPSALNLWVWRGTRALLPAWLRYKLHITDVQVRNIETLVSLYQKFQSGQVRLLLAFRHPTTDDPFTMACLLWCLVPRAARRLNIPLRQPVHSHFIYDRGIALWAGSIVNWLFPRLGGTPIMRGKADRLGLKSARDLLVNSRYPLAVAPEGATNDLSDFIGPLEPGVAQLGFWCAEDLEKAGRTEETFIVPIGIRYSYIHPPWTQLETLFTQIEQACGIQQPGAPAGLLSDPRADALYGRLLSLSEYLLQRLEYFYRRFSVCPCPDAIAKLQHLPRNEQLTARIQIYMESALQVAESRLGVQPQGSSVDRCRRLEQAGWERIFREDMEQLSRIERGLADWLAEDASLALWHMRLAERLTVITGSYIMQRPTVERFAEMFMLLWRITAWIEDKKIEPAPNLGPRRVCLTIGEPLSVTQRLPHYRENRRSARDAVQTLTTDLFHALEQTLH